MKPVWLKYMAEDLISVCVRVKNIIYYLEEDIALNFFYTEKKDNDMLF